MKSIEINVTPRAQMTKNELSRFRGEGNIPAILYGRGMEQNINLSLQVTEFAKLINKHGRSSVLVFKSQDSKLNGMSALIKEVQKDPITDVYLNVDLIAIRKGEKLTISLPIEFVGEPAGLKQGGVIDVQRRQIKVECLPTDIPEKISVDISQMNLNDVIHVSDIKVADGVRIVDDKSFAVISVKIVKEKVETPATPAEGAEGAEAAAATEGAEAKPAAEGAAKADAKTADAGKEAKKDKK